MNIVYIVIYTVTLLGMVFMYAVLDALIVIYTMSTAVTFTVTLIIGILVNLDTYMVRVDRGLTRGPTELFTKGLRNDISGLY